MWLVGSSCLCKLMTSLFSVVSFHRFVLLAHWSPCTTPPPPPPPPPNPTFYLTRSDQCASSLLINMRADGINAISWCLGRKDVGVVCTDGLTVVKLDIHWATLVMLLLNSTSHWKSKSSEMWSQSSRSMCSHCTETCCLGCGPFCNNFTL